MFKKKCQGVIEYLIILAVVIIIALIVVGAMGGLPFGKSSRVKDCYQNVAENHCNGRNMNYSTSGRFSFNCVTSFSPDEKEFCQGVGSDKPITKPQN